MTLHKDQIDQDALAAEWGLALEADAANPPEGDAAEGAAELGSGRLAVGGDGR